MRSFLIDWCDRILHSRLELACNQALSSGTMSASGKFLKVFPMGDQYHPDDFDCFEADMIIPTKRLYFYETWFAYKEAKQRGLVVLLDCETRSIMPLAQVLGPTTY